MGRLLLVAAALTALLAPVTAAHAAVTATVSGGTLRVTGGATGERLALRAVSGGRLVVDVGDNGSPNFTFLRSSFTKIVVNGGGGNDRLRVNEAGGAFTKTERTTFNGGTGADQLIGGRFGETLNGGDGNDTVDGNAGGDKVALGAGNDALTWNAGDGADQVGGSTGLDVVTINGTSGTDSFTVAPGAVPGHVKVSSGPDLLAVETLGLNPLGGVDFTTVANLPGTGLTTVNLALGVGGVGDAAADSLDVDGSAGTDVVTAAASLGVVQVTGLAAQINVTLSEPANDRVLLNGLGGGDTLSAGLIASLSLLTLDGGDGNDTLNGGNGADTLLGGAGNDTVDGNTGTDVALLGAGNDLFVWDPGDGNDIVEGQGDADTLRFNGSAGAEIFTASSNGGRLLFTRNVGNIVMDVDDVETLAVNALGGTDSLTVNDLAATDVGAVDVDLGVGGLGDAAADAVTVNGTVAGDLVGLAGSGGSVAVTIPAYGISLVRAEPANDTLTVNLSSGADVLSAAGLAASSVLLTVNGGTGDDALVGSAGADVINGDAGNDYLNGGDGADTLNGGADFDTIDGGAGIDSASNGENVINVP